MEQHIINNTKCHKPRSLLAPEALQVVLRHDAHGEVRRILTQQTQQITICILYV